MESQREPHFDWLQEGGPASPSRLQISVSEVPKLQAQIKERRSCTNRTISGTFTLHTQQVI